MSTPSTRISWFLIVPFIGVGLVALAVGVGVGWSTWSVDESAQRTDGTVVEVAKVKSKNNKGKNQVAFAPVVQYQVATQTYRIQGSVSSQSPNHQIGAAVTVLYPPDRPAEGKIDSFAEKWLGPLVFGGLGFLFASAGFCMLVVRMCSAA